MVSLTVESDCPNGTDLSAILTLAMWLQLDARKPVWSAVLRSRAYLRSQLVRTLGFKALGSYCICVPSFGYFIHYLAQTIFKPEKTRILLKE